MLVNSKMRKNNSSIYGFLNNKQAVLLQFLSGPLILKNTTSFAFQDFLGIFICSNFR